MVFDEKMNCPQKVFSGTLVEKHLLIFGDKKPSGAPFSRRFFETKLLGTDRLFNFVPKIPHSLIKEKRRRFFSASFFTAHLKIVFMKERINV